MGPRDKPEDDRREANEFWPALTRSAHR
jgi:hypothetical protein